MTATIRSLCFALALTACTTSTAQPAPAAAPGQQFTILIYEPDAVLAMRADPARADAYWTGYDELAGALAKAGVLRGGTALSEEPSVMARGTAGTSASARLSGYFVIEVANLETARSFAAKVPAGAAAVEVRPHRVNPHMANMKR